MRYRQFVLTQCHMTQCRMRQFCLSLMCLMFVCGTGEVWAEPLVIRLVPHAQVEGHEVHLRDVSGSTQPLRSNPESKIWNIDLAEMVDGQDQMIIEQSLIDIRLRLSGLQREDYRLIGPQMILISRKPSASKSPEAITLVSAQSQKLVNSSKLTDIDVEQAIHDSLAKQFEVAKEDIIVRLLQPVAEQSGIPDKDQNFRIEVLTPNTFPLGRSSFTLRFWNESQLLKNRVATADIRRRQTLVVTRKSLTPTTAIQAEDIRAEIQFVDAPYDALTVEEIVGQQVKRTIPAGQILSAQDMSIARQEKAEELIRTRDSVRVVAYRKGLKFVIPAAEALQAGSEGQLIRVRNLQSNRIITGRVVNRGEVEVILE